MVSSPRLLAIALTLAGFAACGRTSLFGLDDDGGVPMDDGGWGTGGTRDSGAGGTVPTGGRRTGGAGGTGGFGGTGGLRDGGVDAKDAGSGGKATGGVGTGGFRTGGFATGGRFDGGVDARTGGFATGGRATGGFGTGGFGGTGGRGTGGATGGFGASGGFGPSGGAPATGGSGTGGTPTGGHPGDAGIYECDPVGQDCAPGFRCDLPDTGQFVFRCLPDHGGQGGQNAMCQDSSDCIKGSSCLLDTDRFGNPIGSALCTVFCYTNTDCPAGNHCLNTGILGDGGGDLSFGLCLPNRN